MASQRILGGVVMINGKFMELNGGIKPVARFFSEHRVHTTWIGDFICDFLIPNISISLP
jgi:hypothetical protein